MMQSVKHSANLWSSIAMISICFFGCIEPFEANIEVSDSLLVIEATITNEIGNQTVHVTRTFNFGENRSLPEPNATVSVVGGGEIFSFRQNDSGAYVSEVPFAAEPGSAYRLLVETGDGGSYSSNEVLLTPSTAIDNLRAERITNDSGEDGIAILVDSFDATGNAMNYRYTYEETYKVIAPEWSPLDLEGDPNGSCEVFKVNRQGEEQVCYSTDFSNTLVLTNTNNLVEDRVADFMVRFIGSDNYILSHRYSILVKQHVQSAESYSFYEALNRFSGSESIFSEAQLGFLEGNIISEDESEKVVGFFDVSSVSEKRLFFDYTDYYPNESLPPYIQPCNTSAPPLADAGGCVLRTILEGGLAKFAGDNPNNSGTEGPFLIVSRVCGDCTALGSAQVPDFWIE